MEKKDENPPDTPPKPRKKYKKILRHSHIVFLEIVATCVLLLAVAAGLLVWRLMQGPVDMGFARNYIQEALRIPEQGLTPTVEDIVLSWPELQGPLLLGFKNAKIFNAQGQAVFAVDEAALSLSKARLLIGQISPVALIVRGPVVRVVRTKNGKIVFDMAGLKAAPDSYGPHKEDEKTALERILRYIARPGKAHHGLGTLEAFKVESAMLVIEDRVLGTSWTLPRMDANFESQKEALNADIGLGFSESDPAAFLKMNINVPWETNETNVMAEFKGFDPWFFAQRIPALEQFQQGDAQFDGQLAAVLGPALKPLKVQAVLSSAGGKFLSTRLSAKPITFSALSLAVSYDGAKNKLEIADTHITAQGVTVRVKAALNATPQKITGPVHLEIKELAQKKIGELWPPMLEGDNAQEWIVRKLSQGVFKDLHADIHVLGMNSDEGWIFGVSDITAGFGFEGMKVDYRKPLFPVTGGKGKGTFDLDKDQLDIAVTGGKIGDMEVTSGVVVLSDIVAKGKGSADISVQLKGPLGTGLDYVSLEPIHVKTKFDPKQVKGDADLKVHLELPTRKDVKFAEVKIGIEGALDKVFLPSVVKDMSLIGGPMAIKVEGNDLEVSGKGELGGRPASFKYNEFLRPEGQAYNFTVQADLSTDEAMRERLGVDLKDYMEGTAPVDLTYTDFHDGHSDIEAKADLTPARVFIDPFDYEKKPGEAGTVTLKARLQDDVAKNVTGLEVTAPGLSLKKAGLSFRQKGDETVLAKGEIGDFTIGESKGSMNFTVDDTGHYKITAASPFFDLRPFVNPEEKDKEPYDSPPMVIDLTAQAMRGADEKKMPPGTFHIDIDGQGFYNRLEVDTGAGKGRISLRLVPDEAGLRMFRLDAEDAGAMLAAFGIYKNIRGGTMTIRGKAKNPGDRNMSGKAEIANFRVVNAPTLARLISALSLPGLAQLLGGEGLVFSKLEADYKWHSKAGGSVLEMDDGRTSGNSVGFSFDGKIDLATSTVDVEGTMVPLSDINKIIKSIPLVGDILTGGSGLIAATYSVRGKTEKPDTMVNPLSVLTPGILRRILFE